MKKYTRKKYIRFFLCVASISSYVSYSYAQGQQNNQITTRAEQTTKGDPACCTDVVGATIASTETIDTVFAAVNSQWDRSTQALFDLIANTGFITEGVISGINEITAPQFADFFPPLLSFVAAVTPFETFQALLGYTRDRTLVVVRTVFQDLFAYVIIELMNLQKQLQDEENQCAATT